MKDTHVTKETYVSDWLIMFNVVMTAISFVMLLITAILNLWAQQENRVGLFMQTAGMLYITYIQLEVLGHRGNHVGIECGQSFWSWRSWNIKPRFRRLTPFHGFVIGPVMYWRIK